MLMKKIFIISCLLIIFACGESGPPSTRKASSSFATTEEKVAYLHQYVPFKRTYTDVDFLVWYQNNSGGMVPGPSDWDIRVIAIVPIDELSKWIVGYTKVDKSYDLAWVKEISTSINYSDSFEWYQSGRIIVGIDRLKSIIVYRNSTFNL